MRLPQLLAGTVLAVVGLGNASTIDVQDVDNGNTEEAAVLETVQRFFDSMASRDTAMALEALLVDGTSFSTVMTSEGPRISGFTHQDYLNGLVKGTDQWLERMWDAEVRVHGTIATLWAPYEFQINGEFSHCGIDAFSLVNTEGGWRIASVVYTVEQECD